MNSWQKLLVHIITFVYWGVWSQHTYSKLIPVQQYNASLVATTCSILFPRNTEYWRIRSMPSSGSTPTQSFSFWRQMKHLSRSFSFLAPYPTCVHRHAWLVPLSWPCNWVSLHRSTFRASSFLLGFVGEILALVIGKRRIEKWMIGDEQPHDEPSDLRERSGLDTKSYIHTFFQMREN